MKISLRKSRLGMTLMETMISMGIAGLVVAGFTGFVFYDSVSKAALMNYVELNQKSMQALDKMSSELREMVGVIEFNPKGTYIVFTNASSNLIAFRWNSDSKQLTRENLSVESEAEILLEDCYEAKFQLFDGVPGTDLDDSDFGANEITDNDPAELEKVKLVLLNWSCQRVVKSQGNKNTESVQTAKIVLRN